MVEAETEKRLGPLARWYADPLSYEQAHELYRQAGARTARHRRHGGLSYCCRLQLIIARFWLGQSYTEELALLKAVANRSAHARILAELVEGQLLISRRLAGAYTHLHRAFIEARSLLKPADYFLVYKRHNWLQHLPLSDSPLPAASLEELIETARVIERLNRGNKIKPILKHYPDDTFG